MDYKTQLHHPQAAALWRAIALRRLSAYRAARHNAEVHGDKLTGLIEPPSYAELTDAYTRLVDEILCETIDTTNVARCTLDLIAAIAQDQQFTHIFDDASVASMGRDKADQIQLIEALSDWINKRDIAEAVAAEREARS